MHLRVGVKAIIIRHEKLLVVKKRDGKGVFYSFPGGGQEAGETLIQAVQREMVEETGLEVQVGNLLFVREYIGKHHENAETEGNLHVVDHLFHCLVEHFPETFLAKAPDTGQEEIEWLSLNQLRTCRFYPQTLIPHLIELGEGRVPSTPVYVGDIN
jgi:8-oxo-dGTP diphosphatase